MEFKPGERVMIEANPHMYDAEGIVGEVVRFEAGAGFMRSDLAWIRFQRPRDGSWHELPFTTEKLVSADRDALLARAARHEEQARELRKLAGE